MEGAKILAALNAQKDMITEKFGSFDARVKELETRIASTEKNLKPTKVTVPGLEDEKKEFSFLKAINGIKNNDWDNAGFEKEVFDTTKAMSAGTGADGGYIVPTQYIAEIIELLRADSVVMSLGATMLNDLTGGVIEFPKQTGGASAYWVDENADITPSQQTLGNLTLSPKAVACLVKMSNRLLKLSNPSAEAMIRRDIALTLALKIDLAAMFGSGVESEPLGIANTPGISNLAIGDNGGVFNFAHVSQMEGLLEDENALRGNLGFAWHGKVKRQLKRQKYDTYTSQTTNQPYITQLPMSDAKLKDALGYNFATSSQVPTDGVKGTSTGGTLSSVIFANWLELLIAQWGGMEIFASSETSDAFQKNQTWVRIIQEVDMGLRHPESFSICADAETVNA